MDHILDTIRHFYKNNKETLNIVLLVLVSLSFIRMLFSSLAFHPLNTGNLIDGSWSYTLASFFHKTPQLYTRDVFFSYGPLYQLIITIAHHTVTLRDVLLSNLLLLTLSGLLIWPLIKAFRSFSLKNKLFYLAIFVFANLISTPIDAIFMLYLFLIGTYMVGEENKPQKILMLLGLLTLALYKNSFLLAAMISIPFLFFKRKHFKSSLIYISTPYLLLLLLYFVLSRFQVLEFWSYFYYSFINAATYSEIMSLPFGSVGSNDVYVIAFSVILLSFLATFRRNNWFAQLFKLIILFLAYKQSVVRSDGHLFAFFIFVPIIVFEILDNIKILQKKIYVKVFIIVASFIITFIMYQQLYHSQNSLTASNNHISLKTELSLSVEFLKRFYIPSINKTIVASELNFGSIQNDTKLQKESFSNYLKENNINDAKILNLSNVTVYAESLGYPTLYTVMLQYYPAHPFELTDSVQKERLRNMGKNEFVFVTDALRSVDNRDPFSEMSETFNYLFTNYKVVASSADQGLYIFGKYQDRAESCSKFEEFKSKTGEVINLPVQTNKLKIEVNVHQSIPEKIIGSLIKPDEYRLVFGNGKEPDLNYRTFISTLNKGFYVNPFYRTFGDVYNGYNYKPSNVKILTNSKKDMDVRLYSCSYAIKK